MVILAVEWAKTAHRSCYPFNQMMRGAPSIEVQNPIDQKYVEFLTLIKVLCACYDRGEEVVAISLSAAIRVMVHDTHKSTSLLMHLGSQ